MTGGVGFSTETSRSWTVTSNGDINSDMASYGWSLGDVGFFGFKFMDNNGNFYYGWGEIDIHGATGGFNVGRGFTVTQAYYNDTPDTPIAVGDTGAAGVPEIDPAGAGSVLSLVMGSLAMLERRRLRRKQDSDAATVSA